MSRPRGHVRRRGKTWAYVVSIPDNGSPAGRRREWHSGFKSRSAAQKALTVRLAEIDERRGTAAAGTVSAHLAAWIASVRSELRPSTWRSYRQNLEAYVIPRIGDMRLRDLQPQDLNGLYDELLEHGRRDGTGLAPRTVRYTHTILRKALGAAVSWGALISNPAARASAPRSSAAGSAMRTWTADEVRAFLEATAEDRNAAMWAVAARTGVRRGELLGLRWSDIDFEAGRAAIRQTVLAVGNEVLFSEPKTKRSRRLIALDRRTLTALREHRTRQVQDRLAWGAGWQDTDLVFCREDGSPAHPDRVSARFRRLIRDAGLPKIRLHDLRHTWASLALAAGIHPKVVSERLGHSTISITLDTYSHAIPALEEEAAERIADLIG